MNIFEEAWLLIKLDPEQDPFAPAGVRRKARKARRKEQGSRVHYEGNKDAIRTWLDDHKQYQSWGGPQSAPAEYSHMDELHSVLMDNLSDEEIEKYGQMIQNNAYNGLYEHRKKPDSVASHRNTHNVLNVSQKEWQEHYPPPNPLSKYIGRTGSHLYDAYDIFQHSPARLRGLVGYREWDDDLPDDVNEWNAVLLNHDPLAPSNEVMQRVMDARTASHKEKIEEGI